jgi:hypothetical protein
MSELRQSVIVRTREDVAAWAEDLWSQCLNEAARALVGSAAGEYLAMFGAIEAHHRAQEELRAAIEDLALEPDDPVMKALANVAAMRAKACPGEVEVRAKLVPLIVQTLSRAGLRRLAICVESAAVAAPLSTQVIVGATASSGAASIWFVCTIRMFAMCQTTVVAAGVLRRTRVRPTEPRPRSSEMPSTCQVIDPVRPKNVVGSYSTVRPESSSKSVVTLSPSSSE